MNDHERIYVNGAFEKLVNLKVDYYNTGNIKHASLDDEKISNSGASRLLNTKCYIDLDKGELVANFPKDDEYNLKEVLQEKIENL